MSSEYKPGDRVELISMADDPDPIPAGSKGTVVDVDDADTVHVQWDSGRSLGLLPRHDRWRKIHDAKPPQSLREAGRQ